MKRLLPDHGSTFRSRDLGPVCNPVCIVHRFTRPYRPQTSGEAERSSRSTLREWAYGTTDQHATECIAARDDWIQS